MKMINGVSMIPFGLLAGFADQNEIRIIELAENGFRFRMAKNQKNIKIQKASESVFTMGKYLIIEKSFCRNFI